MFKLYLRRTNLCIHFRCLWWLVGGGGHIHVCTIRYCKTFAPDNIEVLSWSISHYWLANDKGVCIRCYHQLLEPMGIQYSCSVLNLFAGW